jgi:hypothetical protein
VRFLDGAIDLHRLFGGLDEVTLRLVLSQQLAGHGVHGRKLALRPILMKDIGGRIGRFQSFS